MKVNSLPILILSTVLGLSACASTAGKKFDTTAVSKVKIGQTTTQDTILALGEPFSRNIAADGTEAWQYQFIEGKAKVGAKAFIPYAGAFLGNTTKTKLETSTLDLKFSSNTLRACNLKFTTSNETSGGMLNGKTTGNKTSREVACGQ